jgi:O-acetyl-ADP-ribose deacetylase (regulator of RNase III)
LDALVEHPGKMVQGQLVPLRSIAFCCISAGGNAFPKSTASKVAVSAVRRWLETNDNADKVDLIVFCISKEDTVNYILYEEKLQYNFPVSKEDAQTNPDDE